MVCLPRGTRLFTVLLIVFDTQEQVSLADAQSNYIATVDANKHNATDPTTCSLSSSPTNSNNDSSYVSILNHLPTIALHKYVTGI